MTIEQIYKSFTGFYKAIEDEYSECDIDYFEWETLHLRYLLYYIVRYNIRDARYFTSHHYRTSYRLYVQKLVWSGEIVC